MRGSTLGPSTSRAAGRIRRPRSAAQCFGCGTSAGAGHKFALSHRTSHGPTRADSKASLKNIAGQPFLCDISRSWAVGVIGGGRFWAAVLGHGKAELGYSDADDRQGEGDQPLHDSRSRFRDLRAVAPRRVARAIHSTCSRRPASRRKF